MNQWSLVRLVEPHKPPFKQLDISLPRQPWELKSFVVTIGDVCSLFSITENNGGAACELTLIINKCKQNQK
jgi:hypothetical protein